MSLSINDFRRLFRANGYPGADVLFAVNETTGETRGDPAWDNPQPVAWTPQNCIGRRMEWPAESARGRPPTGYGRYR